VNLYKKIKLIGGFAAFIAALALALLIPNGTASANFTGCRDSGDPSLNASIVIFAGAIGAHSSLPYTPVAGDEIAVFNGSGQCAGKVTYNPAVNNGLTAWGAAGGMTPGETMQFRIWDSVGNRFFTLDVTNISPDAVYQHGGLYFMNGGSPTAVTLQSLTSTANMPVVLLVVLLLMGAAGLFTAVSLRRRAAV
jgi:hypothetical protein